MIEIKPKLYIRPARSSDLGTLVELYMRYLRDLSVYDSDIPDTDTEKRRHAKELLIEYAEDHSIVIYAIMLEREMIGFFVAGNHPESYSFDDVYIIQFFIDKMYQRQGYGTKVIKLFTESSDFCHITDDISLFVLDSNPAILFWEKTMGNLGYTDLVTKGAIIPPEMDSSVRFCYFSPCVDTPHT